MDTDCLRIQFDIFPPDYYLNKKYYLKLPECQCTPPQTTWWFGFLHYQIEVCELPHSLHQDIHKYKYHLKKVHIHSYCRIIYIIFDLVELKIHPDNHRSKHHQLSQNNRHYRRRYPHYFLFHHSQYLLILSNQMEIHPRYL